MEKNCAGCGKVYSSKPSRKVRYCSFDCYNKSKRRDGTSPCSVCGKPVYRTPAHKARMKTGIFCSHKCHGDSIKGKNHPLYRGHVKKSCVVCNKVFSVEKRRKNTAIVCGRSCHNKWMKDNHPRRQPRFKKECGFCGMGMSILKRDMDREMYCSRNCANKAHSERMKGEKSPNYVNGSCLEEYSKKFVKLRKSIRAREGFCCFLCEKAEKDNGQGLDIHHVDYDKANDCRKNLVGLCKGCHSSHNGGERRRIRLARKLFRLLSERYGYPKRSITSELLRTIITSRKAS